MCDILKGFENFLQRVAGISRAMKNITPKG
jgi:hypothetical protein